MVSGPENTSNKTCLCGRPLYDEEDCIFHSKKLEQKSSEFNEAFWEEFENQKNKDSDFDFVGFIFPDSIYFHNIKFEKTADFSDTVFHGEKTFFVRAKFSGEKIVFSRAKFLGKTTDFSKTEFTGEYTAFNEAKFLGENTYFSHAKFAGEYIDFTRAEFTGKNTYFRGARFSGNKINFGETVFADDIDFSEVYF